MFHPRGPTFLELAQQALSSTTRGYDLLAPKFDYTPFRTPQLILDAVGAEIQSEGTPESAVDICCGTGAAMEMLRAIGCPRIVGMDLSQGMLDVARQRLAGGGEGAIGFFQGDVLSDMPDEQFQAAACFGAFGHILPRDEVQFVRQVHRMLVPGGRFYFVTTTMPSMLTARYWLSRGFNAAMHVRNLLLRPPFIMFYLTFLLPDCAEMLERSGFSVKVQENLFSGRLDSLQFVTATKQDASPLDAGEN